MINQLSIDVDIPMQLQETPEQRASVEALRETLKSLAGSDAIEPSNPEDHIAFHCTRVDIERCLGASNAVTIFPRCSMVYKQGVKGNIGRNALKGDHLLDENGAVVPGRILKVSGDAVYGTPQTTIGIQCAKVESGKLVLDGEPRTLSTPAILDAINSDPRITEFLDMV